MIIDLTPKKAEIVKHFRAALEATKTVQAEARELARIIGPINGLNNLLDHLAIDPTMEFTDDDLITFLSPLLPWKATGK